VHAGKQVLNSPLRAHSVPLAVSRPSSPARALCLPRISLLQQHLHPRALVGMRVVFPLLQLEDARPHAIDEQNCNGSQLHTWS